jgi:predicted DNA-binding transcriptional regulator YafY
MSRKGESITLSLSERDRTKLVELATELGFKWGDKPNISKLLKAIAQREIQISYNNDWSLTRIEALNNSRKVLVDLGKITEAIAIAEILRDRSETTIPLKQEIESFLHTPLPPWRQKIDELIKQQKPFRLSYSDAADRVSNFTVVFAQVKPIEKRLYLVCQCLESERNQDVPGLQNNWFLRLDRIQDASVTPIREKWLKDIAKIPVEFHLFERLAHGYERKPDDLEVSDLAPEPPTKKVIRNISSSFWFIREILSYGANCEVVAPESVRQKIKSEIESMWSKY